MSKKQGKKKKEKTPDIQYVGIALSMYLHADEETLTKPQRKLKHKMLKLIHELDGVSGELHNSLLEKGEDSGRAIVGLQLEEYDPHYKAADYFHFTVEATKTQLDKLVQ